MFKYAKLTTYKIKKILRCFSLDFTASKTADLLYLNRRTIDRYFYLFRKRIFQATMEELKLIGGEFECDESYFGAKRIRGKRGRGAMGKTVVFGLLKRDGKVFVSIVKNCGREELLPIIKGYILEGSTVHTDGWKAYDSLILNGYDHYRVYHGADEFARGKSHINGIESFWSFAKRRLAKFNGISSHRFNLYLKECEYRFNLRGQNLYANMLGVIKKFGSLKC